MVSSAGARLVDPPRLLHRGAVTRVHSTLECVQLSPRIYLGRWAMNSQVGCHFSSCQTAGHLAPLPPGISALLGRRSFPVKFRFAAGCTRSGMALALVAENTLALDGGVAAAADTGGIVVLNADAENGTLRVTNERVLELQVKLKTVRWV